MNREAHEAALAAQVILPLAPGEYQHPLSTGYVRTVRPVSRHASDPGFCAGDCRRAGLLVGRLDTGTHYRCPKCGEEKLK